MRRFTKKNNDISVLEQRISYAIKNIVGWTPFFENIPQNNNHAFLFHSKQSDLNRYESAFGLESLRETICERENNKYRLNIMPENVLVTCGGLHAISLITAFLLMKGRGEVYCQLPMFGNIAKQFAQSSLLIQSLDYLVSGQKGIVYINTPHNPTGAILSTDEIKNFLMLGTEIICDMVYDDFYDDDCNIVNPLQISGITEKCFIINSMSKNYGVPGLRIGWIISSKENIYKLAGILEKNQISIPANNQVLARDIIQLGNNELKNNIKITKDFIKLEIIDRYRNLNFNKPSGGLQYTIPFYGKDVGQFADSFLLKNKILLSTSENYYGSRLPFLRIPYCYEKDFIYSTIKLINDSFFYKNKKSLSTKKLPLIEELCL